MWHWTWLADCTFSTLRVSLIGGLPATFSNRDSGTLDPRSFPQFRNPAFLSLGWLVQLAHTAITAVQVLTVWIRLSDGLAYQMAAKVDLNSACRDVKSSNILLNKEGVAKVADLGLSFMDNFSVPHAAGTFAYAAHELLAGESFTSKV